MHFLKTLFLTGFICIGFTGAFAQDESTPRRGSRIINDTLKQVYGPTTSRYFFESDVFFNRIRFHNIDTAIQNFHRFTYIQKQEYRYQNLGNIGTASRSIFYQVPTYIGANAGHEAYDLYWEGDNIRYFDTKSSYSNLRIILGGKGRSVTKVVYSRNINPRWNFGFNVRTLAIDKQVNRRGKGDRNVKSTYYDLFTTYQNKDSTYRLFFNVARNNILVNELGGVAVTNSTLLPEFFVTDRRAVLTDAQSTDLRLKIHLFHEYQLGRGFQLYHKLDRSTQRNEFTDVPAGEPQNYYDHVEIDSAQTNDEVKFTSLRNEVGIKGNISKLFYNGYYAIRQYNMTYKYLDTDTLQIPTKGTENYIGGRMELQLDSIFLLSGWAEVLDNGNFRLEASLKSKWLEASLKETKYNPSFMQQAYRGAHDVWNNNFSAVDVTQFNGFIHFQTRKLHLSPGFTFTRLNNFIFFKQDKSLIPQTVLPEQAGGSNIVFSPEFRFSQGFGHFLIGGDIVLNTIVENSESAVRLPDVFANGQFSYANIFVHGNLDIHTGFDVHYQSSYYAMAYDVPTQQFYVQQNEFLSPAFPLVDFFFNFKIKRARLFVKYNNIVQTFTKEGYFPTPYYPGQGNVIDFGFDWSFYD